MRTLYQSSTAMLMQLALLMLFLPRLILAQENQPPVAFCNSMDIELDANGEAYLDAKIFGSGSYDPDGDPLEYWTDPYFFNCNNIGNVNVTLTVRDPDGATSTCTAPVTVVDETDPVAKCVPHFVLYLDNNGEATLEKTDIDDGSYDNCGVVYTDLMGPGDYDCGDIGTFTVSLHVQDNNNNVSVCNTELEIRDISPPTFDCKDITLELDENGEAYINHPTDLMDGSPRDNCENYGLDMDMSKSHFTCADIGNNAVKVTVTDQTGNASFCYSDVTVEDNSAPYVRCNPVILYLDQDGEAVLDIKDLDNNSEDNCTDNSELNFSIIPTKTLFTCADLGSHEVDLFAGDEYGNFYYCTTDITVVDELSPTIECTSPVIIPTDPGVCTVDIENYKPEVDDNCDYDMIYSGNRYLDVATHTVTWLAQDGSGNQADCDQTVNVVDVEPPVITCPDDIVAETTDPGECYATIASLGTPVVSDNCGIAYIDNDVDDLYPGNHFPFGLNKITRTVVDLSGTQSQCIQWVEVNKIQTTTEVTVTPGTQQYSDTVNFRATVTPGVCDEAGQAATHVTFYVNLQPMGDPVELVPDGSSLVAMATYPLLELEGFEGTMDPSDNPKLVTAVFRGVDPDFIVANPTTSLTVTQENACAGYAGVLFASTTAINSSEAIVTLAVTVEEEADGYPDDLLTYARVQFYNETDPIGPELPLGPVTEGDKTIGTAVYEWPVDLGNEDGDTYSISADIVGYYTNAAGDCFAATDVTVSKPLGEFITGGGYLVLENPAGIKSGEIGTKNSFGFNVRFNKKMTGLKGNINTTIRRDEDGKRKVYKAKGTAFTSLAVNGNDAVFTGKAVIHDITDPHNPLDEEGNAIMQMSMTDNGEGMYDLLGITLWNKRGGLWHSSNWNGIKTVDQLLDAGNLVIHKSNLKSAESFNIVVGNQLSYLKVYPNPFDDKVTFEFAAPVSDQARIDVYDITGRMVQTVFEGYMHENTRYMATFKPLSEASAMYFYRMQLSNSIYNGKLIYKQK